MNPPAAPYRVLIIDDEKGLRDLVSYALRRMKHLPSVAEDGEKGVAAALAGEFDAVVCDVMMPGLDGFAVLETLKAEKPGLEIILVTGFPTDEAAARARALGAFDYIAKPFDLPALCAVIEAAAARARGAVSKGAA